MKCKLILAIVDGFGLGENTSGNAIYQANPKFINYLMDNYPMSRLKASQQWVGLEKDQPGNSEVGHLTIGAGEKVLTGRTLVDKKLKDNKKLLSAIKEAKKNKTNIHLIGLASNGGVHSSLSHLYYLIDICNKNKIKPILHLFSDGRDLNDQRYFIKTLKEIYKKYLDKNLAKLASISGRHYAMDRNGNFDRTESVYNAMVNLQEDQIEPIQYVMQSYENNIGDEFIVPKSFANPITKVNTNDTLIFFNYRSDRIRQLTHLFSHSKVYQYNVADKIGNVILTMTDYKLDNNEICLVPNDQPETYIGEVLAKNNLTQLRIAETEKYAHVTYFIDGLNINKPKGCDATLIPSIKVHTFDEKPKMRAKQITDEIIKNLDEYDVIIVNYANADMVGHTGKLKPTIKAIKELDKQLKKLYSIAYKKHHIPFIVTSDHGNADKVSDENGIIYTSHTLNDVPFIIIDKNIRLASSGDLTNVAPTIFDYLGVNIPKSMNKSLILR